MAKLNVSTIRKIQAIAEKYLKHEDERLKRISLARKDKNKNGTN